MFNKLVSTFNNLKNLDYAVLDVSPTATNEEVNMAYERKKYLIANGLILDPYGNEIKDIDTFINKSQPPMMDSAGRPIPGTGGKGDPPGEVSRKTRVIDFRLNSLKSAWKSVNRKRSIVD